MFPTPRITLLEAAQIQRLDHLVDEERRIAWLQTFRQMRREQRALALLVHLEQSLITHAAQGRR